MLHAPTNNPHHVLVTKPSPITGSLSQTWRESFLWLVSSALSMALGFTATLMTQRKCLWFSVFTQTVAYRVILIFWEKKYQLALKMRQLIGKVVA